VLLVCFRCHTSAIRGKCYDRNSVSQSAGLICLSAMIQAQPELIVARVSSHVTRLIINNGQPQDSSLASHPESSTTRSTNLVATQYNTWTTSSSWMRYLLGSYEYWKQNRQHKGKEREEFSAKLTVPFWPERMWDCRGYETLSGWRVNLQTYRILPINSPFFNAVEDGDIDTVRTILANRQASVTDRAYSSAPYSLPGINIRDTGDTALHVSNIALWRKFRAKTS
jgi:hypothetical protein